MLVSVILPAVAGQPAARNKTQILRSCFQLTSTSTSRRLAGLVQKFAKIASIVMDYFYFVIQNCYKFNNNPRINLGTFPTICLCIYVGIRFI